jgi:hypothetical protein
MFQSKITLYATYQNKIPKERQTDHLNECWSGKNAREQGIATIQYHGAFRAKTFLRWIYTLSPPAFTVCQLADLGCQRASRELNVYCPEKLIKSEINEKSILSLKFFHHKTRANFLRTCGFLWL